MFNRRVLIATAVSKTAAAFLLPIVRHARAMGWEVELACDFASASPREYAMLEVEFNRLVSAPWPRTPRPYTRVLRGYRFARSLLASGRYAVVHMHTPVVAGLIRLAQIAERAPTQLVYTAHGFPFASEAWKPKDLPWRMAERMLMPITDVLTVMNDEDWQFAHVQLGNPRSVHFIEGVGLPGDILDDGFAAFETSILPTSKLLFVGELSHRKRPLDLLIASSNLGDLNHRVVFVGDGPLRGTLERESRSMGIHERVDLLGWRQNVVSLMRSATVLVSCSEREGLPRVVLEAMALGLPVIGASAKGTVDLLRDGRGFLYDVGDVAALSQIIRRILSHPSSVIGPRQAARNYVKRLDAESLAQQYVSLYEPP